MKDFRTKNGIFTGGVGIGTTEFNSKLTLEDGDIKLQRTDTGNSKIIFSNTSANMWGIGGDADGDISIERRVKDTNAFINRVLTIEPATVEVMRIDSTGNVGIGATSPNHLLQLLEDNNAIYNSAGASTSIFQQSIVNANTSADTGAFLSLSSNSNQTATSVIGSIGGSNAKDSQLVFLTRDGSATGDPIKEHMRIDSAGYVGIGTTNPVAKLEVSMASENTGITYGNLSDSFLVKNKSDAAGAGPKLIFYNNPDTGSGSPSALIGLQRKTDAITAGSNEGNLVFWTRGTVNPEERMRIDSSGNVGIGTTDPKDELHVNNASSSSIITVTSSDTSSARLYLGDQVHKFRAGLVYNNQDESFALWGYDAAANTAERMRIKSNGNVGIGTTSPSDELTISAASPAIRLVDESDSSHGTVGYNASFLSLNADGGQDTINSGIQFNVDSSEKMRIDSDGNVGIGTDSPTAPLHVVGKFANNGYGVFTASTSAPGVYVNKTDADLTQSTDYIHFRNTGQFSGEISYDGTDVVISQTSDARLKENIKDSGSGLNIVNNLQIRSFDWVGEKRKSKRFGFIAQEMHKVFKEAVKVGGEDENEEPWAISDSKLIPVLTKAIQEQQQIIDQLKSQNESQQSTINDLASRIETLENK
jgi:hypothetical protein